LSRRNFHPIKLVQEGGENLQGAGREQEVWFKGAGGSRRYGRRNVRTKPRRDEGGSATKAVTRRISESVAEKGGSR
jgi:hypothetical protein